MADLLAQTQLRFNYDSVTGDLTHKLKYSKINIGDMVGSLQPSGYTQTSIKGKKYYVHRLCYLLHHGDLPDKVDHINHNRSDNRIENLRNVSSQQNNMNRSLSPNSKSGHIGVNWSIHHQKWIARIKNNSTEVFLGLFKDKDNAIECRKAAERLYGYHINHGDKTKQTQKDTK